MHALREEGDLKVLWGTTFALRYVTVLSIEVNFYFSDIDYKVPKSNENLDLFQYQTQLTSCFCHRSLVGLTKQCNIS